MNTVLRLVGIIMTMKARKPRLDLLRWSLLATFFLVSSTALAGTSILWLDELDLNAMQQEFGKPQVRQSVAGKNLTVAGKVFARGIGTHAKSSLALDVRGKALRLEALVGVDDGPKTHSGSVEFVVLGDGKALWHSGIMKGGDPAKPVSVDASGVKSLELQVTDGGDGIDSDHADWLNARLVATAPLDHLYPPDRKSPEAWNRLSEEQVKRGYQMEAVAPGVWRLRFGQPEKLTPIRFQEHPPCLKQMATLPSCTQLPIKVSAIGFKTSGRGSALELPLEAGEQLYGLGMNLKVFQLLGGKKTVRVSDDQGTVLGDSHAPAPFYVSTRGYGIYVDTARYASFYFGNLDAVRDAPAAPKPATGEKVATSTEDLYRPRELGAKFVGVDVPSAKGVEVYVFSGPDMRQAVQRYNLLSGGGCLPPMWGLGVWYRASAELGQKEVLSFLQEFRERQIPCDVFGLEPGWHSQSYPCSFVWNQRFPDPEQLLRQTKQQGYELNLWEHAFTHLSSPLYKPLLPWSGDYKVWGGLAPDFATPQGRRIFADYHAKTLVEKGVSGFKLDECDHQPLSATPWSFPEQSVFPSGLDGEQMHLLMGPLYQRTMGAIYRDRNQRTLGLVRASGALAAPLPFGLYSDAYNHRDYVRAVATSGFGGTLWCPEVRDMGSLEELCRRLQTSVFSAITQIDCWYLKNPVWKQIDKDLNNGGRFMANWERTEATCRKLLQMRMRLLPYLYSAYADYHYAGMPPTRALVMDYPEDPATWAVDDQYMLGSALMVAPLFTGQQKRSVYLPEGDWYDFWTHTKYSGGRKVEIEKPQEEIPVFVKGDSLLPLAEPVDCVKPQTEFALTIHVYGAKPRKFVLYEDDGVTFDFEKGKQSRVELSWNGQTGSTSKTGDYNGPGRYKIIRWTKTGE
jgi:alpha-D-xyloside xylohydrolase